MRIRATEWRRHSICVRLQTDVRGAIGSDVVLIRSELASLSRDSLELLLGWRIGVSNVEKQRVALGVGGIRKRDSVEVLDNFITDIPSLKSVVLSASPEPVKIHHYRWGGIPGKSNAATVSHVIPEDLAGQDSVVLEDVAKLLRAKSAVSRTEFRAFAKLIDSDLPPQSCAGEDWRCKGWSRPRRLRP
jgi:hypothetical protein